MDRSKSRHVTWSPQPRVAYQEEEEDGGDPKHQIMFSALSVEGRQQRGPEQYEGFQDLLEKLSGAHDREVRRAVEQLESEKAELERQNRTLRSQLVELRERPGSRARSSGGSGTETVRTHIAAGASMGQRDQPGMLVITDAEGASPRDRDPTEECEGDGDGVGGEEPEGGEERFPPRPEYTKEEGDLLSPGSLSMQAMKVVIDEPARAKSVSRNISRRSINPNRWSYNGLMARYVASPRSTTRTAWEIAGCALIGWDLFIVPLAVFCYPVNGVTIAMEWITLLFWTLNVPQTLTVGYEAGLKTKMVPSSILKRYLKSWFLIDMAVLVPDWMIVVMGFGSSTKRITSCDSIVEGAAAVKLLRNLRIMRLMRLTRIARLQKLWQLVKERIYSMTVNIVANILTMLLLLLVLSHFISCLWYSISYNMNGDNRWLHHYQMERLEWSYLYATCLHWSLTQFTPAPMNIQPQNLTERVFTISVVICALVGFSYVVGSITGSLAQLRGLKEEESKLFWDLRVYLKHNAVEHTLAVRIQRYLSHAWRYQACNKSYAQIKILKMLSEQLQNELLFQLHANHLTVFPLILALLDVSKVTVFRLARTAISTKDLANGDHLFICSEKPSHMYMIMQGRFEYKRVSSAGMVLPEMVDKGEDWIAEPVLWSTEWYHLGNCIAVETSSLTLVSPHHFCEEAKRNPLAWALVTTYCRNFMKWLNSTNPDELSDITQGDHADTKALVNRFMADLNSTRDLLKCPGPN